MSFDPKRLAHPKVLSLHPYQPGKPIAECQREFGLSEIIKLASNENPLGTSRHVTHHLQKQFNELARYPDGNGFDLKQALSQHLNISSSHFILGNGSEDVLRMLIQTFVWGGQHIMISEYAFVAYKILAQGLGIDCREIPAKQFSVDFDAMLHAVTNETRMVIIANPNNPTGTYVNEEALQSFLEKLPSEILVVCDEAYYEYIVEKDYPQTLSWMARFPNLIVTRTFSKAYGLAGLRVGYGIAGEGIVELVNRIRKPFNVNHLGQVAATLALGDQLFVQDSIALNETGKKQLYKGFDKLGLRYIPSFANFVMVEINLPEKDIYQELLKCGVIIRPLAPYRLAHYFRITIGTEQENAKCLAALEKVLLKENVV